MNVHAAKVDARDRRKRIGRDAEVAPVHQKSNNALADESVHCIGMCRHQVNAITISFVLKSTFNVWFN